MLAAPKSSAEIKKLKLLVDKDLTIRILSLAHKSKRLPRSQTVSDEIVYKVQNERDPVPLRKAATNESDPRKKKHTKHRGGYSDGP